MTTARAKKALLFTTAAASLLVLAGCGQGQNPGSGSPSSDTSPSASQSPSDNGSPSGPASATGTDSSGAPGLCKSASLTPSVDSTGGGAAGSVYQKLILSNSGTAPCILKGFPGVSLVTGPTAGPIGAPADRDTSKAPVELLLQPGDSGAAVLRYTQAGLYPDCKHVPAAGFRIYPPEDTASVFLAQQREACSNAGIKLLTIGAFQAN